MKSILFTVITIGLMGMFACSSDPDYKTAPSGTFEVKSEKEISVDKQGKTYTVEVNATVDYTPLSSQPAWCVIGEKDETGFSFTVQPNTASEVRTAQVVVAAVGFEFESYYRINITQAAGDPQFSVEIEERNKTFSQAGGDLLVLINGNVSYEVETSQSWLSVSDIKPGSFKLTATPNGITQRNATVLVKPSGGFPNVPITVKQAGGAILKNGWFTSSLENWTVSGTEGILIAATDQYIPANAPSGANYVRNNTTPADGFECRLTQKLSNVPDGIYTLSASFAGTANELASVYLISQDKNGVETQTQAKLPGGGWLKSTHQVTVSGGECTVGVYVKANAGTPAAWYFKVLEFEFQ